MELTSVLQTFMDKTFERNSNIQLHLNQQHSGNQDCHEPVDIKSFFSYSFHHNREILLKLFDKHRLSIENCNIALRSAPGLPLSLDQPVKHLLLDDLIVTGKKDEFNP